MIAKLSSAIAKAVADSAVQARLNELGADPIGNQSETFQKFLVQEVERWGVLVQRSGATVD